MCMGTNQISTPDVISGSLLLMVVVGATYGFNQIHIYLSSVSVCLSAVGILSH